MSHLYELPTMPQSSIADDASMADGVVRSLVCLIEGDTVVFPVESEGNSSIMKLKEDIKEKRKNGVLRSVDAVDLILWKVRVSMHRVASDSTTNLVQIDLKPPDGRDERKLLIGKNVHGSVKLEDEFANISSHWPESSVTPRDHIHVVVELPSRRFYVIVLARFH
jgi:hypothetical protein